MAAHKDLTGDDLHEPKGIASAPKGFVYVALGNGSGVWKLVGADEINKSGFPGLLQFTEGTAHTNINATKTAYTAIARAGALTRIVGVIDNTVTSDTNIQFLKNGSVSLGTVLIPAASIAGYLFNFNLPAPVSVVPGDYISMNANGTGTAQCILNLKLLFNYP